MVAGVRWSGFRLHTLTEDGGNNVSPKDLAYDADRDAFWGAGGDPDGERVWRWGAADFAFEDEFSLPAGFIPWGIVYDGTYLWVSDNDTDGEVLKLEIGASSLTVLETHNRTDVWELGWHNGQLWSCNNADVQRHEMTTDLPVEASWTLTDWYARGIALPTDRDDVLYLLEEHQSDGSHRITQRDISDLSLLVDYGYTGDPSKNPGGLTMMPGVDAGGIVNVEPNRDSALVRPGYLTSTVLPRIHGDAHLDTAATVRVSDDAFLPASLWAGSAWASLDTLVLPRFNAHLAGTVEARFSDVLTSTVKPTDYPVEDLGRLVGHVITQIVVESQDFRDVSAEVGSQVSHRRDGVLVETLDRVVQLVEATQSKTYPRARTSEYGAGFNQDRLRRGDAVLYAVQGDDLRPGDVVEWQGQRFEVVGGLGWHYVGNVRVYQELGLRRLPVGDRGRMQGTVNTV